MALNTGVRSLCVLLCSQFDHTPCLSVVYLCQHMQVCQHVYNSLQEFCGHISTRLILSCLLTFIKTGMCLQTLCCVAPAETPLLIVTCQGQQLKSARLIA